MMIRLCADNARRSGALSGRTCAQTLDTGTCAIASSQDRQEWDVRIETVLREAQDGQTIANLARAFHLPPKKVETAVGAMLSDLVAQLLKRAQSRRSLAGLVE